MDTNRIPAHATETAAPKPHDLLKEMLADINAKFDALGEMLLEMQGHGDLHDEHVELARKAKDLAGEAHAKAETLRGPAGTAR